MYFVYEYNGFFSKKPVFFRLLHYGANFLYPAGDGGKINKGSLGLMSDNPGEGSFSHSRRAPENHGGNAVVLYKAAQYFSRSQKMLLAYYFV